MQSDGMFGGASRPQKVMACKVIKGFRDETIEKGF